MSIGFTRVRLFAVVSLILLATGTAGSVSAHASFALTSDVPPPPIGNQTIDDLLASVAASVPAFGGMYVDEGTGTLHIWLTDQGQSLAAADQAIQSVLGDPTLAAFTPVAESARYSFTQLKAWSDQMMPVLSISNVVSTDIDDRTNRLTVGVENLATDGPAVGDELSQLGIPAEAVDIVQTDRVTFTSTLQDKWRPVLGGIQIEWTDDFGFVDHICSLGFVAQRIGVRGFVTASHCGTNYGGVDTGGVWHQPNADLCLCSNNIGKEIADPPMFTGGSCPSGRQCRYSDSSFASLNSDVTSSRGLIAHTDLGSITWNGSRTYKITSSDIPSVGETVHKEGRTTGHTKGQVQQSCVNVNISGTSVTILCSASASFTSGEGDSGGPVFRINSAPNVFLQGILFAGTSSLTYYSPISSIQRSGELGSLTFCAPTYSC
jgi:hypothetical protein